MQYRSISTFIADDADMARTIGVAAGFAARQDAHLDVCCMGVDSTQGAGFYAGAPAIIYQDALDNARETAERLEAAARRHLQGVTTRWGTDSAVLTLGGVGSYVGLRARFSDLVILPRPYGEGRGLIDEATLEAALFEGGAPVLVVPDGMKTLPEPRRIVIAWNQSNEALSAVRRALPLLCAADLVNICVIDPPTHGAERSDPGGLLTQMLARHGVRAEVSVLARTMPRVSDVLNRQLQDFDADLLVMGAYGHSRLREAILGGTTREVLEGCRTSAFLAH